MIFEIETVEELQNYWRDPYVQWWAAGMPSFNQRNLDLKNIRVKFRTKEDREHFASLFGFVLTDRTAAVWYPPKPREIAMASRYVEQGYEQDRVANDCEEDDDA